MGAAQVVHTQGPRRWDNYHKTGWSELKGRYALRSGDAGTGRQDIAEGAAAVHAWLRQAQDQNVPVRPVGGAWSPSNIQTVQDGWMLNTRRYNRCFKLKPGDVRPGIDPAALLLVEGGVQIDEINDKLEEMERSLRSTGASNGQTIAGACATGTHGSVIEAGGIQDHVRAVQIVAPGGIFWIEPAAGVMSDAFIAATGSIARRDDEAFAAALVAVGSLGIVTAMVIETAPIYLLQPILKLVDFSERDIDLLSAGDFRAFSAAHGLDEDPYFVMVITNPFRPFKRKAVVRFLYRRDYVPNQPWAEPAALGAGYDAFTLLGWLLRNFPWARGWITQKIMELTVGKGITDPTIRGTWGQTTETHKPLADIFTGALFCDRADLGRAFRNVCRSFTNAGGSTVITLRFIKGGFGLLSPARWQDTAGIDCDGPFSPKTRDAFGKIMGTLDDADIRFTRHWGKFNGLDAGQVARDYGPDLVRWKAVRDQLLPNPADRRLFATRELDHLGLTS